MRISIIIPTYNRKAILRPLLESLVSDTRIPSGVDLEIIVSDDRSYDGTADMVRQERRYGKTMGLAIRAA